MQNHIYSIYQQGNTLNQVQIFSYSTNGIPGLNIVGLGKHSQIFKEKIVYVTKMRNFKIPLKRYVLCVENIKSSKEMIYSDIQWLEFPMLLLFWSLIGILPMSRFQDCIATGTFSISGLVEHLPLNENVLTGVASNMEKNGINPVKLITENWNGGVDNIYQIQSSRLFEQIPGFKFI